MKKLETLMQEIIALTTTIESDYPELHRHLNETPIQITKNSGDSICTNDLKKHLETLKEILNHYIKTHPNQE